MNDSGIYGIRNRTTGHVYIGSSSDLERRWRQHRSLLNRGAHPTPRLQAAWLAHGEDLFLFVVLETCRPEVLVDREQWWLDTVRPHVPDVGYNELSKVRSDWSNAEFRRLMSAANKRRANTPEGRAQIKAARAKRKDYSQMSRVRSFRKPGNQHRLWTAQDELYLMEHYGPDGAQACAKVLGRPLHALYIRASKLGLKKGAGAAEQYRQASLDREARRRESSA